MHELHQMFLDLALMTEQQGEVLDQIEFNVKSAGDHVEDGNDDINKAIYYLKKVQKKKMVFRYVKRSKRLVSPGCDCYLDLTLLLHMYLFETQLDCGGRHCCGRGGSFCRVVLVSNIEEKRSRRS